MNAKDKLLSKLHIKHGSHSAPEANASHAAATGESSLLSKSTEHHTSSKKSNNTQLIFAAALLVILVALVIFVVMPMSKPVQPTTGSNLASNGSSPVIFLIKDSTCTKCFKLEPLVAQAFNGLNSSNVESSSEQGKILINKYNLAKLPAVVIQNYAALDVSIQNTLASVATRYDDAMVLYSPTPPYLDLASGEVKGEVSLTVVTANSCKECSNFSDLKTQLETQNVLITNYSVVDAASAEGKALVQKYGLNFAPFILFSSELSEYTQIASVWNTVGVIASDGSYVQTVPNPPVLNLTTNDVDGLVTLTYLNDSSCATCYDVTVHKKALAQPPLALKVVNETTVDISTAQGKALIAKYNLTQVPTVIVSKEASIYKTFVQVWPQVGIQTSDGSYIISDLTKLSGITYKDLKTGNVTTNAQAVPQ